MLAGRSTTRVTGRGADWLFGLTHTDPDDVAGDPKVGDVVRDLGLWYNEDGSLWVAAWSQWAVDPNGVYDPDPNDPNTVYQLLAAREFRGGGMGRYLVRDIDVRDPNQFTILGPTVWTDRLGGAAYGDFETDASTYEVTERGRYLGFARRENTAPAGSPESWTTRFEQRDMLGSLTQQTDPNGVFEFDFGYTAFGNLLGTFWNIGGPADPNVGNEPNQPPPTRQMYAGAWQYESDLLYLYGTDPTLPPITLQHVGYRWYQPEIGRFVQRDPIGIEGGLNCYVYCSSNPIALIDPSGLRTYQEITGRRMVFYEVRDEHGYVHYEMQRVLVVTTYNDDAQRFGGLMGVVLGGVSFYQSALVLGSAVSPIPAALPVVIGGMALVCSMQSVTSPTVEGVDEVPDGPRVPSPFFPIPGDDVRTGALLERRSVESRLAVGRSTGFLVHGIPRVWLTS